MTIFMFVSNTCFVFGTQSCEIIEAIGKIARILLFKFVNRISNAFVSKIADVFIIVISSNSSRPKTVLKNVSKFNLRILYMCDLRRSFK